MANTIGAQVRAARALTKWTRDELSEKSGVDAETIKKIEAENVDPRHPTIESLREAFLAGGVEWINGGARFSDGLRVLEGETAYQHLLDDIFYATRDGNEVLWFCSDDRSPRPGEIEAEERIRSSGTRFRVLIEDNNPVIRWDKKEYRTIPSEYFNHNLQVIYGSKVAQLIDDGRKILIIDNASFATTERNKFNMLWPLMRPFVPAPKTGKKNGKTNS